MTDLYHGAFCRNPLHPGPCKGWKRKRREGAEPGNEAPASPTRQRRLRKAVTPVATERPPVNIPDPQAEYRRLRNDYNGDVLFFAEGRQQELAQDGKRDQRLDNFVAVASQVKDSAKKDEAIDRLREYVNMRYNAAWLLDPAPDPKNYGQLPTMPPGPRTEGGPRPPETAPYDERLTALDQSIRSGIDGQKLLGQGAMGDTRKVALSDGSEAVYKRAKAGWGMNWGTKEQTDAETLAAMVAAATGTLSPAVLRASDTEVYQEVAPGVMAIQRGWVGPPEDLRDSPEGLRMGLLDVLIGNQDRHAGNWMVDGQDMYAIDHGLAFQPGATARESPFAQRLLDANGNALPQNDLSPDDVDLVRVRLERMRPQFRELGRGDWFNSMMERLDDISRGAAGKGRTIQ